MSALNYTGKITFFILNSTDHCMNFSRFALKFVISLLNYLGYWFLSVLHSPILKCFYTIAMGYRLIRLIICDYLLSTLKLWDQNLNSHLLPLFISYRSSGEKLIKYQANLSCMITSVILMTILFYKALILQGEIKSALYILLY